MKILTLDRFESHDRLLEYKKQAERISQGCIDCIRNRPPEFENHPFYVWAHVRTADDGYNKRMLWMPRLSKPSPETNSMLFRVIPPNMTDIHVIWTIPPREIWSQFEPGRMTHDPDTWSNILHYEKHRSILNKREEGDVDDDTANEIYRAISNNAKYNRLMCGLYTKQELLEPGQVF